MKPAALLSFVCLCNVGLSFKICAFNIQSFGETKARNKQVMTTLVKIISRCDVCLIEEVRDSKGEAVPTLIKELNKFDKSHNYSWVESKRLGKTSYKEQYVFVFRDDVLRVRDRFQYPDSQEGDLEAFSREPFAVRFHSPHTAVKDFVLVAQHTCPKKAVREIDELYQVFQGVRGRWRTQNIMFLGDFNAACGYVTAKDWDAIRLRKNPDFSWLIGDEEDTTVSEKTHCAYDRIVVHGKEFLEGIVPNSARPFNFKKRFRLTEEEALEVSDHFPIEVDLKLSPRQPLHSEL
ncbi:deoxyribonuclease I-like 1-like isoform X1 [Acipenser oxyrinchus oxyrinchus]|uniref:Deoxyribonuclease n=1 Tax=Acipenser oxyrinchus oxyrinchus TaxID=40147 RepID=A0AAD8FTF4_ACIOX|nr:deoxyribonuclease I-like 1-like isoform X1 [Acipenser oxyrinchus oxyrinchus]